MAARSLTITPGARAALTDAVTFDGPRVTITRQLTADGWREVKAVVERLGAVYVVGSSAFDFEPDQAAADMVRAALARGSVMAAAAAAGYVPTPAGLADEIVYQHGAVEWQRGGLRVLEPSAGTGPLVRAILRDTDAAAVLDDADAVPAPDWLHVTAVESDPRRAAQLAARNHPCVTVRAETFEQFAEGRAAEFDRVIMNPPFSTPGHPDLWAEHVLLAWRLLAPGGRLVAIVPASALQHRASQRHRAVRALIDDHGAVYALDRDAFAESGTLTPTAVMWLDRPPVGAPTNPPAPVDVARPWLWRTYQDGGTVVPVPRPYVTPAAARLMPLQAVPGFGGPRVLCFRGHCHGCHLPAWGWADGDDDVRGGWPYVAGWSISPDGHDGVPENAPRVVMCGECAQIAEVWQRAEAAAVAYWRTLPADMPAVGDHVSVRGWSVTADVVGHDTAGRVIVDAGGELSHVPVDMVTPAPVPVPVPVLAEAADGWGAVLEQLALPV